MLSEGGPLRHSISKPPPAWISEKSLTDRVSVTMWPLPIIPPQRQPAAKRIRPAKKAIVILFIIVLLLMRWPQRRLWIQIISDFSLDNSLYSLCAVFNSAWVLPLSKVQRW